MKNRVVITGLGPVTPIGMGKDTFFENLKSGKNGISKIEQFDTSEHICKIGGEVKDFNPEDFIDKKESKKMDKYTQFAFAAAKLALEDSKLNLDSINRDRAGVFVGNGIGGMQTLHNQYEKLFDKGPSRISPFFIPMVIANMAAGQISIAFGIHGRMYCYSLRERHKLHWRRFFCDTKRRSRLYVCRRYGGGNNARRSGRFYFNEGTLHGS